MNLGELRLAIENTPKRRLVNERFWHQGPTSQKFGWFADPADTNGRYHRVGDGGVWYASDQEQAAWAEFFRHFVGEGVDPFEIRRRVGHIDVSDLAVLDLTDQSVRELLGVAEADLVGDDYSVTQEIAEQARRAGFQAILAPSAAMTGRRTLVVFSNGLDALTYGPSNLRMPPPKTRELHRSVRRSRRAR